MKYIEYKSVEQINENQGINKIEQIIILTQELTKNQLIKYQLI